MKKFILLLITAILLFNSCAEKKAISNYYYPVDSLITAQQKHLISVKAVLTKTASIDGKEETISFTPESDTAWMRELDVFVQLEAINKPINIGKYHVEEDVKDTKSNLHIHSINSIEEVAVDYLHIYYLNTPSTVRKIEAHYQEESSLMKTSRILIMEFQDIHNKSTLTSYSINGWQKMLLGDSVRFFVKGTVTIP